jgi:superoxide dismutase, Cu-Zn family
MVFSVRSFLVPFCIAAPVLLLGCASAYGPEANVALRPTVGSEVSGNVRFFQRKDVVQVTGEVHGLAPNTEHGFHIHEIGNCTSGDGMSAGGHLNPDGGPHGRYGERPSHAGDLPSLVADANGVAHINFETRTISVQGGGADVVGRGLIVDRDPDDYRTQPTGNSGPRLACGVIATI